MYFQISSKGAPSRPLLPCCRHQGQPDQVRKVDAGTGAGAGIGGGTGGGTLVQVQVQVQTGGGAGAGDKGGQVQILKLQSRSLHQVKA